MRKLVFVSFIVVVSVTGGATLTALRTSGQKVPDSQSEVPTPVQEGVLSARQIEHSKLYRDYRGMGKLRDLAMQQSSPTAGVTIFPGTPELSVAPKPESGGGSLDELAATADAIVIGSVTDKTSQLTENGTFIFTDYQLRVEQVLKANPEAGANPHGDITVTRPGGKVLLEGRVLEARDRSFNPLAAGERYLLFLKYIPATGAYRAVSYKGSFDIGSGKVKALTEAPDGRFVDKDLDSLMQDVLTAISKSERSGKHE